MGTPVAVLDLAREMIQLAGLEPDKDIPIVFTQPSPGEKLFEDILTAEEGTMATKHQRIFVAKTNGASNKDGTSLWNALEQLQVMANQDDKRAILESLCKLLPNFSPDDATYHREVSGQQTAVSSQRRQGS